MGHTATLRGFAANWIENAHYLSHGIDRPTQGSRASALVEMNWLLRRYLMECANQPEKGEDENREALDLSMRASTIDKRIYEAGKDDAVANVSKSKACARLRLPRGSSRRMRT